MSWPCRLVDIVGTRHVRWDPPAGGGLCGETRLVDADGVEHAYRDLPIGTMFHVPDNVGDGWPWDLASDDCLSDYYRAHNSGRRPLFVVLPGRHLFLIDGKCWSNGEKYSGWQVTGEAPNITVSPSINIGGHYHGWLQNGVITDDCEGRKFDDQGKEIR